MTTVTFQYHIWYLFCCLHKDKSEWLNIKHQNIKTGVPQGSLIGPIPFNTFINDFSYDLKSTCCVYNYADDNTLSFSHHNPSIIKNTLEEASQQAIRWFNVNLMRANPSKFQAICLSKENVSIDFEISSHVIEPDTTVKLPGVNFDNKLNFHR